MLKHEVVNIINFIRACEPRAPMDLVTPVKEQIKLIEKHNLCGTFLMQYDALIDPQFVELIKGLDPTRFEIGVWHETVEPEVKAAAANRSPGRLMASNTSARALPVTL